MSFHALSRTHTSCPARMLGASTSIPAACINLAALQALRGASTVRILRLEQDGSLPLHLPAPSTDERLGLDPSPFSWHSRLGYACATSALCAVGCGACSRAAVLHAFRGVCRVLSPRRQPWLCRAHDRIGRRVAGFTAPAPTPRPPPPAPAPPTSAKPCTPAVLSGRGLAFGT